MFFRRLLTIALFMLAFASSASAQAFKVGTVDYGRAIQEIEEGKSAQDRLDKMYAGEKAKIEMLESELMALQQEYQSRAPVLSDAAKQEYEQKLYAKNMEYQQAYSKADYEMQAAYFGAMEQLMGGLKLSAEELGKEKGYDLILEVSQGTVLFAKEGVDMTDEVVQRYNASH